MCTLTIVPQGAARYRLLFNRDEARTRPAALPPERRRFGGRDAILPIDPVSGGTWLAVNDAGLALVITNVNPPEPRRSARRSRGGIIPALAGCGSLAEALLACEEIPLADLAPFRLVLVEAPTVWEIVWDGESRTATPHGLFAGPLMFTSSGLGDHLVEGPRRRLFEELVLTARDPSAAADAFHRHTWPDQTHLSVNMSRADARTVSRTLVEISHDDVLMTYTPLPGEESMARLLLKTRACP